MPRLPTILLAFATLSACAGQAPGPIRYADADYRPLTGRDLRTALTGKMLTFPEPMRGPIVLQNRCHLFHPGGVYQICADRISRLGGTYAFRRARVCATLTHSGYTACWMLYAAPYRRYLLRMTSPDPAAEPERVTVAPIQP